LAAMASLQGNITTTIGAILEAVVVRGEVEKCHFLEKCSLSKLFLTKLIQEVEINYKLEFIC